MRPSLNALARPAHLVLLTLLVASPAFTQSSNLAVGGQLGSPSGVSLTILNPGADIDILAAWDLDDFLFVNAHLLYDRPLQSVPDTRFFYGPGAFLGIRDNGRDQRNNPIDDDVVAGLSATFGLGYRWEQFEFFGQLTPRLALTPNTDGDLGGGLGLRFFL